MPSLRRNELINRLKTELPNIANISKERVHFSIVLILSKCMLVGVRIIRASS